MCIVSTCARSGHILAEHMLRYSVINDRTEIKLYGKPF